jgi:dTDP-glucose pyrophosphorylase/predicted transcriptional regulator
MKWVRCLAAPKHTILETIKQLDSVSGKTILIVDDNYRLLGTVTDGDIRRAILAGTSLDAPVKTIMNTAPRVAHVGDDPAKILNMMRAKGIRQIPLVDSHGRVVGLETIEELIHEPTPKANWVVLMAGGLGTRLQPLTNSTPKPLLRVGNKPILETILEMFIKSSFRHFYISVNYKAEMVKAHFGDGQNWNCEIRYLEEDRSLGTAGALGLISDVPAEPLVVMNGDLLTNVNFENLLDYHYQHEASATVCVREYDFQVPFGVVSMDGHRVIRIEEKPVNRVFVNGGIYVLSPSCLALVQRDTPLDMPALLDRLIARNKTVAAFPIREYWLDIGRPDDLRRAGDAYTNLFK